MIEILDIVVENGNTEGSICLGVVDISPDKEVVKYYNESEFGDVDITLTISLDKQIFNITVISNTNRSKYLLFGKFESITFSIISDSSLLKKEIQKLGIDVKTYGDQIIDLLTSKQNLQGQAEPNAVEAMEWVVVITIR